MRSAGERSTPGLQIQKRSIRALHTLLVVAVLVPAILFGVAAWQNRAILFDEASQRTVKTATILEQHAASTMQIYELVFLRVEDYLRLSDGHPDRVALHQFLSQLDEDAGQIDAIFVMDADGNVTAHSRYVATDGITAADRDYFSALKERGERIAVGNPVAGRLSGQQRLNIAYRLASADGHFSGAVAISVSESYFAEFYRTVREGPADVMSLVRADGAVLARSPPPEIGARTASSDRFRANVAIADGDTTRIVSVADGVERLYAFRKIADYPIYVSYGLDLAGVQRQWRDNLLVYATIAVPAALLLLLAVWTALHRARQEEAAVGLLRAEIDHRTAAETQRDEAEAALRQAQKMEAIGQMTGGLAHDFNNLLTVVIGNLDMAAADGDWPPPVRQQLATALKAAQRGGVLTQQLLAFARRQMLRPEIVNPNRLIEDFTQLIGQAAGQAVEIRMVLSPTLDPCRVDRAQFEAAILNLVVNARDAMRGAGRITIVTQNIAITAADAGANLEFQPGAYVLVAVSDTGEGMVREVLDKAFEPFFTTKGVGRGSGLGLSMVYGFVKQSGGHVQIESEVGLGTTVKIYLPRSAEDRPERPVPATREEVLGGSEAILLVEDNEDVLEVTVDIVRQLGYDISVARDAAEALAILRSDRPIDALFTDVVMPGGMAGDQLASTAVLMRPGLKVLLTSGYAAQIASGRPALEGDFPMIAKPYRRAELANKLREILGHCTEPSALDA